MKTDMDCLLKEALTPTDEPDMRLNQRILNQEKGYEEMDNLKFKKPVVVALCVLGLCFVSVTGYAAQKYLKAHQVAEVLDNKALSKAFQGENAVLLDEKQCMGDFEFTLLGVTSGKNITDYLRVTAKNDGAYEEKLLDDRTYCVVAIKRADGGRMPEISDADYGRDEFLVSPLIAGLNPKDYNVFTMHGGYGSAVIDGVMYRIVECDNVELFADHKLYLAVQGGTFYDVEAYDYDESTGEIAPNKDYDGINVLFDLPLDSKKADPKAAGEYIEKLKKEYNGDAEADTEVEEDLDDSNLSETEKANVKAAKELVGKLTAANLNEYAVPVESTRKTLTPDAQGMICASYEIEGRGSGSVGNDIKFLFPDGKTGMSDNFSVSYSEKGIADMMIATFTLNEDGTVTFVVYVPKNNI